MDKNTPAKVTNSTKILLVHDSNSKHQIVSNYLEHEKLFDHKVVNNQDRFL